MANFSFLSNQSIYRSFAPACLEAEKVFRTSPVLCAIGCRKALELAIKWVYAADTALQMPYKDNLKSLIYEDTFRRAVNETTWKKLFYVVNLGNLGVHTNKFIKNDEAYQALTTLFEFVQWLDYSYGREYRRRTFDAAQIPNAPVVVDLAKVKQQEALLAQQQSEIERYQAEIKAQAEELSALKNKNQESRVFRPMEISEWETRKRYIDLDLKLMDWDFDHFVKEEVEVDNMAGIAGQKGYVDYVLFGQDGFPLAVVEAKRTSKDPNVGKQQAKLYADALEKQYGRRPMMFMTNGFETKFWDDLASPPRRVFSVFSQDDLARRMARRNSDIRLKGVKINTDITNRPYQLQAIASVCDHLEKDFRRALLVMATGTGKTRTTVSLVDVLMRGNYVTNVLFLADRRALVGQAKNAFQAFLPDASLCNLLSSKDDKKARIVFSTYPTILNAVDEVKNDKNERLFTPAHFDLIIVDEAHRSIFKKYKAIFDYFDAPIVGLTATPKTEVDRNTYEFFETPPDNPTFAYDYETAVNTDHVLVPYRNPQITTKFLEEGIVYDDLSEEDKDRYEEDFADEDGNIPEMILPAELNRVIFNKDTVDLVLDDLMRRGIKIQNGDVLGKTIIFAQNKQHAQFIVERFDALYPHLKGRFVKRVVCGDDYAQTIIDEFKCADNPPNIVVSVDMMDTGIDVPEVVNLVFFKKVRSKTKFWQMIGRGTRLCPNLCCSDAESGTYQDKKYFYIFDYLGNFEFFRTHQDGIEGGETLSNAESVFGRRVRLVYHFQDEAFADERYRVWRKELIETLVAQIGRLNTERVSVHPYRQYVDTYKNAVAFTCLTEEDKIHLIKEIAPLIMSEDADEAAVSFDNFLYGMMLAKTEKGNIQRYLTSLTETAKSLLKKTSIPQIKEKTETIKMMADKDFLNGADLLALEQIRTEIRPLIKFLIDSKNKIVFTDLHDVRIEKDNAEALPFPTSSEEYKERVNGYILKNKDRLSIQKLIRNLPMTEADFNDLERVFTGKLGTKDDYQKAFQDKPLGLLVREIAKVDREAAQNAFADFIADNSLTQQQIVFVERIIDYIVQNGYIKPAVLNLPPFDRPQKLVNLFDAKKQEKLYKVIETITENAVKVIG
ncbi:MAG: DEAD/DEAH box helicase family protein [Alphaproteobacteria bacterium]|nr:DEAD/DEAH box helicase family protein [Alphaproteobacteria bacterium]